MSSNYTRICSQILYEFFGSNVQKVGDVLFRDGQQSLRNLAQKTDLPVAKVKEILRTLLQHNLVKFESSSGYNQPFYAIEPSRVYFLLRIERCIDLIAQQLGDEARELAERLSFYGQLPLSRLLYVCGRSMCERNHSIAGAPSELRMKDVTDLIKKLFAAFEALVVNHFCCRGEDLTFDPEVIVPELKVVEGLKYVIPPVDTVDISAKIVKKELLPTNTEDSLIVWQLDAPNFYREWRDEIVVEALKKRFGKTTDHKIFSVLASKTFSSSLVDGLPLQSPGMTSKELTDKLCRYTDGSKTADKIDQHLEVMLLDPKTVIKVETTGGGTYCLDYAAAINYIVSEMIEKIIQERHDYVSVRIFRLVSARTYVELDQISETGMIPSKTAKNYAYQLIHENFIKMKEIRKTYNATAATNKINYFLYVDLKEVASSLLENCYKSIENAHIRRQYEKWNHRMVLMKEERVSRIHNTAKGRGAAEEQLKDIEELITPPEREVLNRAWRFSNALTSATFHMDETIFLLEQYFYCLSRKYQESVAKKAK